MVRSSDGYDFRRKTKYDFPKSGKYILEFFTRCKLRNRLGRNVKLFTCGGIYTGACFTLGTVETAETDQRYFVTVGYSLHDYLGEGIEHCVTGFGCSSRLFSNSAYEICFVHG